MHVITNVATVLPVGKCTQPTALLGAITANPIHMDKRTTMLSNDELLQRMRKIVEQHIHQPNDYDDLIELFDMLDARLTNGGALPEDWNRNR